MKIGSLTAEIFLIRTNVARTRTAWTNVTLAVGICKKMVLDIYLSSMIKIGSVSAEIFLIWSNVASTNVP